MSKTDRPDFAKFEAGARASRCVWTLGTLVLAGLGYWSWAWLTLALGAFLVFGQLGVTLVIASAQQARAQNIAITNK